MKRLKIKILLLLFFIVIFASAALGQQKRYLVISNQETGEVYKKSAVKTGDELTFSWEHSFERIPWNEFYRIEKDGTFLLETISVAGFGAGIPAEMDCTYRYENGMIYMENIGSRFPQFNWINSQTALKGISLNGTALIYGSDMPHHQKCVLKIQ